MWREAAAASRSTVKRVLNLSAVDHIKPIEEVNWIDFLKPISVQIQYFCMSNISKMDLKF